MEQYIKKSALVARIRKLKMDIGNIFNEYDEGFWEGRTTAFDDVICALDTSEVKEVDLEKGPITEVNLESLVRQIIGLYLEAGKYYNNIIKEEMRKYGGSDLATKLFNGDIDAKE